MISPRAILATLGRRARQAGRLFIVLGLAGATGCLSMRPAPRAPGVKSATQLAPAAECAALDRRAQGFTGAAVVAGGIGSGAGGLSARFTDNATKYSLAGVSAGLSVAGAVFSYFGTYSAKQYTNRCSVNAGGKP